MTPRLPEITAVLTIVGGRVVYERARAGGRRAMSGRAPVALTLALGLSLLAGAPAPAAAQDRRSHMSEERAGLLEAVLGQAFPGAAVDWDRERFVWPDGRAERVELSRPAQRADGDEVLALTGVVNPEHLRPRPTP